MRYAFVSDIHGNLTAWNTVLQDMAVHIRWCSATMTPWSAAA